MTMPADAELHSHLRLVARGILKGSVVPVLGAGANLCDRAPDESWRPGANLPSGAELAAWLAREFECEVGDRSDLLRVSQYADVTSGEGPLYERLHELFDRDYPIPTLHRFLATLPARMAKKDLPVRYQLIVTTNYDDLMERALREAGEPFDVVRYLATGRYRGKFIHDASDAGGTATGSGDRERVIAVPKRYDAVSSEHRTVVLKIHGAVDRADDAQDSYVITEDHYIDYLTHTTPNELIPVKLLDELLHCHFLFLGYAMRDWNLRVILHRIWGLRDLGWKAWAVQAHVDRLDARLWGKRDVELHEVSLSDYIRELAVCIDEVIEEQRVSIG